MTAYVSIVKHELKRREFLKEAVHSDHFLRKSL